MTMPLLEAERTHTCFTPADAGGMTIISADRVVYCGLLGARSVAMLGSITFHVALDRPFQISFKNGRWNKVHYALVMPFVSHQLRSADTLIATINIEPEGIDCDAIPWMQDRSVVARNQLSERIRLLYAHMARNDLERIDSSRNLDKILFDGSLPMRDLDPRIEATIALLRENPHGHYSAEECANKVDLSFSRFIHLFREEIGTTFRRYVAWKRARSVLRHINVDASLADIAKATGYADATHFSHAIREIYGMKPKDILTGHRELFVIS